MMLLGPWQAWECAGLSMNCVLTPPLLPAPRCPVLLVVGDSSPAVDAVVRRHQPLVFVLNSASTSPHFSPFLHPSGQVASSNCHFGLWAEAQPPASFPGDCQPGCLAVGPPPPCPGPLPCPSASCWLVSMSVFSTRLPGQDAFLPFGRPGWCLIVWQDKGHPGAGLKDGFLAYFTL